MNKKINLCPCQSGQAFETCCEPYLTFKKNAPTAEALMRSRYTAFALKKADYLVRTWHPKTVPSSLEDSLAEAKWIDLKIVKSWQYPNEPNKAFVEFIAKYRNKQGRAEKLHEVSLFIKQNEHWFYVNGEFK